MSAGGSPCNLPEDEVVGSSQLVEVKPDGAVATARESESAFRVADHRNLHRG